MRLFLLSVALVFSACHSSQGDKNNGTVAPVPEQMEKASKDVCLAGQNLVVADPDSFDVGSVRDPILVVSGDGPCAQISNLNDQWLGPGGNRQFIRLGIPAVDCIPNNSIWEYSSGTSDSWEAHYQYTALGGSNTIKIDSSYQVGATYLRDHAGIRVLDCQ